MKHKINPTAAAFALLANPQHLTPKQRKRLTAVIERIAGTEVPEFDHRALERDDEQLWATLEADLQALDQELSQTEGAVSAAPPNQGLQPGSPPVLQGALQHGQNVSPMPWAIQ